MNERTGWRIAISLGIALLSIWLGRELWGLLQDFGPVLALFFSAWLISFVLSPPTDTLVRLGLGRPTAVLIVYLLAFAGLFLATLLLIPLVAAQLGQLIEVVNSYTAQTSGLLTWLEAQARALGIREEEIRDFYRSLIDQVRTFSGAALQNALTLVTGAAAVLVNIVFCLIISVYIMLDGRRIVAGGLALLPRRYRGEVRAVLTSIGDNFGGYIRGSLILAIIYAAGIALAMSIARLDYIAVCALFAGVAMLIPFIGAFVSLVPPLLIAFLSRPGDLWWIAILLIVVQQVVLNVAGPRVYGQTTSMHPLLVIGGALSGATLAGVWGALFGIPVAGILASIVRRLYLLRQQREADQLAAEAAAIAASAEAGEVALAGRAREGPAPAPGAEGAG